MQIAREHIEVGHAEGLPVADVERALERAERAAGQLDQVGRILPGNAGPAQRKSLAEHVAKQLIAIVKLGGGTVRQRGKLAYNLQKALRKRSELELLFHGIGEVATLGMEGKDWHGRFARLVGKHPVLADVFERHGIIAAQLTSLPAADAEPIAIGA